MTLFNGFNRPVDQAQQAFRLILKALSEPGSLVTLANCPQWEALSPAATGVLLTLADGETPLYLTPALHNENLHASLRFHTGAPLVQRHAAAHFAVFDHQLTDADLAALPCGDEVSPETGATVLVQIAGLAQGDPLRLRGPGIKNHRDIAPRLPGAIKDYLLHRPQRFPLGLDFILACQNQLLAIPRTTHVEVC